VDHALFCCFVQGTDGLHESSFRFWDAFFNSGTGILDCDAGFATVDAIAKALLVILAITFDLRLDVSHNLPPIINTISRRIILQHGRESVQTENLPIRESTGTIPAGTTSDPRGILREY
jgi:hypothetical protein